MTQANLLAFHIVAVVCWFAGLLYIGRLLIYALEAQDKPSPEREVLQEQFKIMKRRLWFGITTPAMLATVILGVILMLQSGLHHLPWFMLKMALIIVLLVYHFCCQAIVLQQAKGIYRFTSKGLRAWNEVGTMLLIFIVLLVKHKDILPALYTTAITAVVLCGVFVLIQRLRARSAN